MKINTPFKKPISAVFVALLMFSTLFGLIGCSPTAKKTEPKGEKLILATTTSTQDSGLLDVLIPMFETDYGYKVKVVAVGSGEAMQLGSNGNADVLLVHAPADEETFMENEFGKDRKAVMHNDYVLLGPAQDPAGIRGMKVADAFKTIMEKKAVFVSRADNSGTHKKELKIWGAMEPLWDNYLESGQGMGDSLTLASNKGAYILADRGTYLAMKGALELGIMVEGEDIMFNPYHVITINPDEFEKVNYQGASDFMNFITHAKTQKFIGEFGVDKFGQPLFYPDAA
ncbi:MAG: substrate-binding domain-containing protein [Actinomycetota bacterium]|nr:substrate-binding domain-containing protein [Actinomycetota bacterium]